MFRSFSEHERSGFELDGGEVDLACWASAWWFPEKATGDHEVNDQEEVVFCLDDDAFAQAGDGSDTFVVDGLDWWIEGSQEGGAIDACADEPLIENAAGEGLDVDIDVGEFGHAARV